MNVCTGSRARDEVEHCDGKKRSRTPQSELRRVCIKRSYEIIYRWRDQGYPLEKYDTLVKAAFITYLKKHKGIFDPEPPIPPEVEGGSELRENNPASSSR